MPQMAPLNWLMLFTAFILTLIMFLVQNYFLKIDFLSKNSINKSNKTINWKW